MVDEPVNCPGILVKDPTDVPPGPEGLLHEFVGGFAAGTSHQDSTFRIVQRGIAEGGAIK